MTATLDDILFPEIEPYRVERLQVSDLHSLVYEEVGNPEGRPALFLHGGPGVGILPGYRRFFDPAKTRLVLLDQRGAGRSTPGAEIRQNTTWDIVADLEALRRHLGIEDWIVMGGSWGSTLALCYAIEHPESVAALIIRGVFLARPFEIAWLHGPEGAAHVYPDEYQRFSTALGPDVPPERLVAAYLERMTCGDPPAELAAAKAWSRWETAMATLVPDPDSMALMTADEGALSKARIECHFTANGFFMKSDNHILDSAERIAGIPCRIVQGRHDVICPTLSAWQLHQALPKSELRIVEDGSHSPMDPGMARELVQAAEDFKTL